MAWFFGWWESLSLVQQGFALAAIPATVILALQTVLLLFGLGGHDADHGVSHDFDHDVDHDADVSAENALGHDHDADAGHDGAHHGQGVRLFTLRGVIALFAVGGWVGIASCDLGASLPVSIVAAAVAGFAALLITALAITYSLKLQENGNISASNAIAHTATVYLAIPASRRGSGKITMTLQERFVEMDAITDSDRPIPTGAQVQVVSVTDKDELVVRPLI